MEKNVWKSMGFSLALACSLTVMSCGDDDPITPTPDPVEPETPTKKASYRGFEFTLQYDTVIGTDEAIQAFQTMIKDSVAGSGLSFKAVEVAGTGFAYTLKMTYDAEDATENAKGQAIEERSKLLAKNIILTNESLNSPVITSSWRVSRTTATGIDKDWQSMGTGTTSSNQHGYLAIPMMGETTWKAVDAPEENDLETLYFGGWSDKDGSQGTIKVGSFKINGEKREDLAVTRKGADVVAADAEGKTTYGFHFTKDGSKMILEIRDNEELAAENQIAFEKVTTEE